MAKYKPSHSEFEKTPRNRASYLRDVLGRLEDEVGRYLDLTKRAYKQEELAYVRAARRGDGSAKLPRGTGYWAGVRLLMPVVECVAEAMGMSTPAFLRNHLNIKTPSLVLVMFRHALMHNDLPHPITLGDKTIRWGIGRNGEPHQFTCERIFLDVLRLYEDLHAFLSAEVERDDGTEIKVDTGIVFTPANKYIAAEFALLCEDQ